MSIVLLFFIVASLLSVVRVISTRLFINPNIMKAFNRLNKEWQRKYRMALKSRDPRLLARVKKEKERLSSMMNAVSKMQFKNMIINFVAGILLFIYIMPYLGMPIYMPLIGETTGLIYFIIISLAASAFANIPLKYWGY